MMMTKTFKLTAAAAALLALTPAGSAFAWNASDVANITLYANTDSAGNEGIYMTSNGNGALNNSAAWVAITSNSGAQGNVTMQAGSLNLNGATTVTGNASVTGTMGIGGNTTVGGTLGVTGNTTLGGTLGVTGNTSIGGTLGVTGLSTTNGITNTGAITNTGNITNVGNITNTGALTQTGATSITGATTINTSGAAATTIGANGNTTAINSNTINIGTGAYTTAVTIGSNQAATTVNATAGNSGYQLANNQAGFGTTNAWQGASPYPINGMVTTTNNTTLLGGTSQMVLDNNGVTLSHSSTGAPIQLHGVADGTAPTDAINVRQMAGGVASASALAGLPQVEAGKSFGVGLGGATYMGQNAAAFGVSARIKESLILKAGVTYGAGNMGTVGNVGLMYSF
jgi:hypothetical protein